MDTATAAGFAGGIFGGILQVVFDKYYGSKLEQWVARSGIDDDVCNLNTQLCTARAVLEIIERDKHVHNDALSDLIKKLKLSAYDADDALDEMEYYRLQELVHGGTNNPDGASSSAVQMVVRRSYSVLSNPFKRARTSSDSVMQGQEDVHPNFDKGAMSERIRSISRDLKKIAGKVQKIVTLELASMATQPQPEVVNLRWTSSFLTEPKVFGRDEEVNSIINMVLGEHLEFRYTNFSVLPIVGIGGVGKTTLAQCVYNHPRVVSSFDVRAWACVSDTRDVTKVTVDIVDSINHGISTSHSLDAVQKTLVEKIEGKRFFIVLDDVWVINWDKLCAPFSSGVSGSMVVVTTRDQKIAKVMGSFDSLTLLGLQDDEFWSFFKQCANITEENNLAHIGRKIAMKLHGIPLAAKTMGRLLSRSHDEERWRSFLNCSNMWEVRQYPDDMMPVLRLSFQHLPPSLQRCFAYCAVFPKDYKISEQQLISGWMAQGFIQKPRGDELLEDIAKEYLNELLWGSFFEKVDDSHYMMHDLLHDLAQLVSEGECWVTDGTLPIPVDVHHLLVLNSNHARDMGLFGTVHVSGIQSPRPIFSDGHSCVGFRDSKSLRSLTFTRASTVGKDRACVFVRSGWPTTIRALSLPSSSLREQLDAIGILTHLRYLDLSWSYFTELPKTICQLYHLQVLNISHCPNLARLPPNMSNLINLRHLFEDEGKNFLTGIIEVGKMTFLQKLDIFRVQKHIGFHIVQLKNLRHLRGSLRIQNLEDLDNTEPVGEAILCEKRKLNELWLSWNRDSCTVPAAALDVLEGLEPHPNLVSLHIRGYTGITSPTWLADKLLLTSLESLYLKDFSGLDLLPPLGQLPHLRKLHITQMGAITVIGHGFYGEGQVKGFPRLEVMLISNMPKWTEWVGAEQICLFPVLRSLKIQQCPKLNGLQVFWCNEKQWFLQLAMLKIEDCPQVVSYPCLKHSPSVRIQENGSILMKLDHQELCITGYKFFSSTLKAWFALKLYCTHLVSLRLEDCSEVEVLPPLGSLPQLRELHISKMDAMTVIGLGFYGEGQVKGFPRLEVMLISNMPKWTEWVGVEQICLFPVLRSLKIQQCPKLNGLQVFWCNEKQWFPQLAMLKIEDCPQVVSYPCLKHSPSVRIQENGSILMKLDHQELCITGYKFFSSTLKAWFASKLYCTHLVSLRLEDCSEVEVLPPLGSLPQLRELRMIRLGALRQLGSEFYGRGQITGFSCLKKLLIRDLPEWREWNEGRHFDVFPHLEKLSIVQCPELNRVPCILAYRENLRWFPSLDSLEIDFCPKLINFDLLLIPQLPHDVVVEISGETYKISVGDNGLMIDERAFTKSISRTIDIEHWINSKLASAEQVNVSGDNVTDELLSEILAGHICPSVLSISRCGRISIIDLSHLELLESLEIYGCDSVTHLSGLQAFIALKWLTVHGVPGFVEAWNSLLKSGQRQQEQISTSLEHLEIDTGSFLTSSICSSLTSLNELDLVDKHVKSFSEEQEQALTLLISLESFTIQECDELLVLPALHHVSTLKFLEISDCSRIDQVQTCFHKCTALKGLLIIDVPSFAEAWKMDVEAEGMHVEQINAYLQFLVINDFKILNLPVCKLLTNLENLVLFDDSVAHISEEQGQALLFLVSLQVLEFVCCWSLNALPSVLHRMPTLKHLEITGCHQIDSLPDNGLPASLQKLTIKNCYSLYDKCLEHGSERHKIAHISEIILEM